MMRMKIGMLVYQRKKNKTRVRTRNWLEHIIYRLKHSSYWCIIITEFAKKCHLLKILARSHLANKIEFTIRYHHLRGFNVIDLIYFGFFSPIKYNGASWANACSGFVAAKWIQWGKYLWRNDQGASNIVTLSPNIKLIHLLMLLMWVVVLYDTKGAPWQKFLLLFLFLSFFRWYACVCARVVIFWFFVNFSTTLVRHYFVYRKKYSSPWMAWSV